MIDIEIVIHIHNILIEKFGGSKGIRNLGALESAIYRPYQTFDSKELYPTDAEKSAAIFQSIIINHPFIDGNKRIAYTTMRLLLLQKDFDIDANDETKYAFVISASKGELTFNQILDWIKEHLNQVGS